MQTANEVMASTDMATDLNNGEFNEVERYFHRSYPTKQEFSQLSKMPMVTTPKNQDKGSRMMKKFKNKAKKSEHNRRHPSK